MSLNHTMYYKLDENHNPVPATLLEFAAMCETPGGQLVKQPPLMGGTIVVSTIFLGLNQCLTGGIPILFETMIFGGTSNMSQWRYHTWDEAVEGHDQTVEEQKFVLCN